MTCFFYKIYDWWKTTAASRLVYHGQQFKHFGPITIRGKVVACVHKSSDGDRVFDLLSAEESLVAPMRWHCEVTPCSNHELRNTAASLVVGTIAVVAGTKTFDPPHLWYHGGGWEIHPVTYISCKS